MMVRALGVAGVPCGLRFNSVGENGKELVKLLNEDSSQKIGGEAILRVDDRYELHAIIDVSHVYQSVDADTHSA
jgi:mediator of RNA polymerase II transcription subunit 17, fungi type